jgi:hypothetical protein
LYLGGVADSTFRRKKPPKSGLVAARKDLPPRSKCWGLGSTTDAKLLPELKPRAEREHFVVPPIRSRQIACAEWSNIRRFEHFL